MRRVILLLAPVILVSCIDKSTYVITPSQDDEEEMVISLKDKGNEWLLKLCSPELGGRRAGSIYDSLAFSYLKNEIEKLGYDYSIQDFHTENGSLLRNLVVDVFGGCDSTIIIGSHYDGVIAPAANDNASGCVTSLIILDSLQRGGFQENRYNIKICFWDSEEVFEGNAFRGSRYFVSSYDDIGAVVLYLNLDTIGHLHENMGCVRSNQMRVEIMTQ